MTARRFLPLLAALGVAACSNPPIRYIPGSDRALLEADARLGRDAANGGDGSGVSVDQMLSRARAGQATPAGRSAAEATRVLLRFTGEAVQPDEGQRGQLSAFASAHRTGGPVTVTSRADSVQDGALLLGQRRAVAVARVLGEVAPGVSIRFNPEIPDGLVVVAAGATPVSEQ